MNGGNLLEEEKQHVWGKYVKKMFMRNEHGQSSWSFNHGDVDTLWMKPNVSTQILTQIISPRPVLTMPGVLIKHTMSNMYRWEGSTTIFFVTDGRREFLLGPLSLKALKQINIGSKKIQPPTVMFSSRKEGQIDSPQVAVILYWCALPGWHSFVPVNLPSQLHIFSEKLQIHQLFVRRLFQ